MMRRLAAQRFEGKLTADECQEVVDLRFGVLRHEGVVLAAPGTEHVQRRGGVPVVRRVFPFPSRHPGLPAVRRGDGRREDTRAVSETGSVGELSIDNCGDRPVLFLEGEEVRGGKRLTP